MNGSLIALFIWLFAANVMALIPSKDNHWRRAYVLMALAVPLLGWLFYENPWWVGVLAILAGMSMLRWPVIYLGRWLRRMVGM